MEDCQIRDFIKSLQFGSSATDSIQILRKPGLGILSCAMSIVKILQVGTGNMEIGFPYGSSHVNKSNFEKP